MFKNPKFYFIVLCMLIIATGAALFVIEKQKDVMPVEELVLNFQHPDWTDEMILDGKNRIYRNSKPEDQATIVEKTANSFTIVWDKWGTETFVKQENGSYSLQK